jgi:hypothetical protein
MEFYDVRLPNAPRPDTCYCDSIDIENWSRGGVEAENHVPMGWALITKERGEPTAQPATKQQAQCEAGLGLCAAQATEFWEVRWV